MRFLLRLVFFVWLSSRIGRTSANHLLDSQTIGLINSVSSADQIIRISTTHFVPYTHQDEKGETLHNGMEFDLLRMVANRLNLSLVFQTALQRTNICDNVALNVSDICIGGIFPTGNTLERTLMSATYAGDDLTWCVKKAGMMPMYLSQMLFMNPESWFLIIFGYGYTSGIVLYLLIQFDVKYDHRNSRDWHFTTWLVALPACIGMSPNFRPVNGTTRIFFALMLMSAFFFFQIIFTRWYEIFNNNQKAWRQISSFKEVIEKDFHLAGSQEAFNILHQNKKISNHKIESFHICEDISECLVHLLYDNKVAIGGSRQNILNSPTYSPSQIFCFEDLENMASYPVAMYMRKDFYWKDKVNTIVQQLVEAGLFVKWQRDSQLHGKYEIPYAAQPIRLPISHASAALVFLIGVGSLMSISTFIVEQFVFWKMKQPNKLKIWMYLEQFVDGHRHYLKNVPERLQKQNKHSEIIFPYLE